MQQAIGCGGRNVTPFPSSYWATGKQRTPEVVKLHLTNLLAEWVAACHLPLPGTVQLHIDLITVSTR